MLRTVYLIVSYSIAIHAAVIGAKITVSLYALQLGTSPFMIGVLAALFGSESIERKRNTEAIEVAPNTLVSARLTQYSPARSLTLDEARESISRDWIQDKAVELARQKGEQALKDWKEQAGKAKLDASTTVSRDKPGSVPTAVVNAAMRAPTAQLPTWVGVDLGDQGYAVVKVNQVI